jgi:predicted amidohydrolase YtcJ
MHLLGVPHGTRLEGRASVGPRKILLADHDLPPLEAITEDVRSSHANERPVAVHCVTREALLVTLAALNDVGPLPGDRIEHAAVVPEGTADEIARLGVRVVTQPAFLAERGDDYVRDVAPEDREHLYPYASLLAAGVRVAPSSDAPFGDIDPWRIIAAARDRLASGGATIGVDERVPVPVTRDGYLSALDDPGGPPRKIAVGFDADLCLLRVPLAEATRNPSRDAVRMTMCAGRVVARDDGN